MKKNQKNAEYLKVMSFFVPYLYIQIYIYFLNVFRTIIVFQFDQGMDAVTDDEVMQGFVCKQQAL